MEHRLFRGLVGSVLLAVVWPLLGHASVVAASHSAACSAVMPKITLLAPANAVVDTRGATIHFGWNGVPCAAWYNVEVWLVHGVTAYTLRGADSTITAQRVNMSTYLLPTRGWAKGVYTWRVIAATANGTVVGAWSAPHTFTLK